MSSTGELVNFPIKYLPLFEAAGSLVAAITTMGVGLTCVYQWRRTKKDVYKKMSFFSIPVMGTQFIWTARCLHFFFASINSEGGRVSREFYDTVLLTWQLAWWPQYVGGWIYFLFVHQRTMHFLTYSSDKVVTRVKRARVIGSILILAAPVGMTINVAFFNQQVDSETGSLPSLVGAGLLMISNLWIAGFTFASNFFIVKSVLNVARQIKEFNVKSATERIAVGNRLRKFLACSTIATTIGIVSVLWSTDILDPEVTEVGLGMAITYILDNLAISWMAVSETMFQITLGKTLPSMNSAVPSSKATAASGPGRSAPAPKVKASGPGPSAPARV